MGKVKKGSSVKFETLDEFLTRGGRIQKLTKSEKVKGWCRDEVRPYTTNFSLSIYGSRKKAFYAK